MYVQPEQKLPHFEQHKTGNTYFSIPIDSSMSESCFRQ